MRLSITTWNYLHAAQLYFLGKVELSSTDGMTVGDLHFPAYGLTLLSGCLPVLEGSCTSHFRRHIIPSQC